MGDLNIVAGNWEYEQTFNGVLSDFNDLFKDDSSALTSDEQANAYTHFWADALIAFSPLHDSHWDDHVIEQGCQGSILFFHEGVTYICDTLDYDYQHPNRRARLDYILVRQGNEYKLFPDALRMENNPVTTTLCNEFPMSDHPHLECYLSDHYGLSAELGFFRVVPQFFIIYPSDGSIYEPGQYVTFSAVLSYPDNLPVTLTWNSDKQGQIGTGTSFMRNDLVPGTHIITATVQGDNGFNDVQSVTITVICPPQPPAEPPQYDLGDAPDSSNSLEQPMLAYPDKGIEAHYPTVYELGSPPYGPRHHKPQNGIYLGRIVTQESEADVGEDEDPTNNLDWFTPDQDGGDDGVLLPLQLSNCGLATLQYTVSAVNPPHQYMYVNLWFDFNRDGDWDDTLTCPDGSTVHEWAVRNDEQYFFESGTSTLTTPSFKCWHPSPEAEHDPLWMRITISEQQPPSSATDGTIGYGGAGPANGYEYGETEDYYIQP